MLAGTVSHHKLKSIEEHSTNHLKVTVFLPRSMPEAGQATEVESN